MRIQILRKSRGASVVEFALLLLFLPMVIVFLADFGLGMSAYIRIGNLSREGGSLMGRGARADTTLALLKDASSELQVAGPNGKIIVLLISNEDGRLRIVQRSEEGDPNLTSRIVKDNETVRLPPGFAVRNGGMAGIVEVFYKHRLFGWLLPEGSDRTLLFYDRAIFIAK